jgi:purine-binding chemotaxis protein CheW
LSDLVRDPGRNPARRAHAQDRGPVTEYLAFRLGGETYALPLADVREILTLSPITYVPRAAREVLGIVSVRGQLVTVIDARVRLGLEAAPATKRTRILLCPSATIEMMGLYVDEVLQVYRLAEVEVEPVANVLGGNIAEHVTGIGRRDGTMLVLLSLPHLLAPR